MKSPAIIFLPLLVLSLCGCSGGSGIPKGIGSDIVRDGYFAIKRIDADDLPGALAYLEALLASAPPGAGEGAQEPSCGK